MAIAVFWKRLRDLKVQYIDMPENKEVSKVIPENYNLIDRPVTMVNPGY
jgi:hypothetical protein